MEVTDERISDLVRTYIGRWMKDPTDLWRFTGWEDCLGKYIRFREGDGVDAAKTKVMTAFDIDPDSEKVELTYEMPEWMDVDGSVKPVPIHIVTDDDMDMFLAMRVDIHEMKLYVVRMALNMTLEIDGFKVVTTMDDHSFAEVMSKEELIKEQGRRDAKEAIDNIIFTQLPRGHVAESSNTPVGWIGHTYQAEGFPSLSAAMRHFRSVNEAIRERGSPQSVLNLDDSSDDAESDSNDITLTRDLFKEFEKATTPKEKTGSTSEEHKEAEGDKRGKTIGKSTVIKDIVLGRISVIFSGKGINGLNFNNGLAYAGEGTTANEPRPQSQP
ncbi:uncharacterized protein LOC106350691 [Brassica napus]|uniref:uncharacterized protein LOC106350691 n=1 Tax=Brassica napus TaxID=3708 RepID=UPI000BBE8BBA|nr:uncharacterized protein LOC106350691 [Brassica napus]